MAKTKNYELFVVGTGEDPYVKDFISQLCGEEASNMTIIDEKLNSLDQVVENLKTSVSEGKTLIASAVTDMGIQTADDASFAQIASNISQIETGVDTSDATAIETDIKYGKTAYVDGQRIDGKLVPSEIISSGAEVSYKYGEALVEIMMSDGYIESPGSFHVGHVMPVSEMTIAGPIPPITRLESGIRVDVTVTEGVTQNKTVEKYIYPTWNLSNALNATIDFDPDTAQFTTTPSISNMNGPEKTFRLVTTNGSTVMPSTTTQEVVPEHVWTLEPINIAGDTNLISENIKNGITIFGVEGSLQNGIDTSDATATAADLCAGKTAYINGEKITGNIPEYTVSNVLFISPRSYGQDMNEFYLSYDIAEDGLFRKNTKLQSSVPLSEFGDASASDVLAGKTFSSAAGLKIAGSLQAGIDTSDATATASDIASGVTAYVNGSKVTGNVNTTSVYAIKDADSAFFEEETTYNDGSHAITFEKTFTSNELYRINSKIQLQIASSNFGDATAADVASGKTFTSSTGLKVTGTMTSSTLPTCEVTIKNTSSYVIMGTAVDENNQTLAIHWNDNSSTRSFTTSHPFSLIYQQDADISMSMTGVSDLGTSTNNTFETVCVHSFKPTSSSATITIS